MRYFYAERYTFTAYFTFSHLIFLLHFSSITATAKTILETWYYLYFFPPRVGGGKNKNVTV
ncbi:MAG: hypothetical protein LBR79_03980 [Oscillospiraceae bacterium]|nr:hypothetical protein [Oscillospiraceae bacterium]